MKKFFISLAFLFAFFVVLPVEVSADNNTEGALCQLSISSASLSLNDSAPYPLVYPSSREGTTGTYNPIWKFNVRACGDISVADTVSASRAAIGVRYGAWQWYNSDANLTRDGNCLVGTVTLPLSTPQIIMLDIEGTDGTPICRRGYGNSQVQTQEGQLDWEQAKTDLCSSLAIDPPSGWVSGQGITVSVNVPEAFWGGELPIFTGPSGYSYKLVYDFSRGTDPIQSDLNITPRNNQGLLDPRKYITHPNLSVANYTIKISLESQGNKQQICSKGFYVGTPENPGGDTGPDTPEAFALCKQVGSPTGNPNQQTNYARCNECFTNKGVWTALGCIPYGEGGNATSIVQAFIRIGLGIGGGVVVLMVLAGGFILSTSQGDPKRVDEAKAMITSAIMGLVFIIFSITILRFIGVRILQIPGFGS